jgi:hypothetical protein
MNFISSMSKVLGNQGVTSSILVAQSNGPLLLFPASGWNLNSSSEEVTPLFLETNLTPKLRRINQIVRTKKLTDYPKHKSYAPKLLGFFRTLSLLNFSFLFVTD